MIIKGYEIKPGAKLSKAELEGANLAKAKLMGADLHGANLRFTNLSEADLSEANLAGAYLSGADLRSANLQRANLTGAILTRAQLVGANLMNAQLSNALLSDADITNAKLDGADLTGTDLDKHRPRAFSLRFNRSDLGGALKMLLAVSGGTATVFGLIVIASWILIGRSTAEAFLVLASIAGLLVGGYGLRRAIREAIKGQYTWLFWLSITIAISITSALALALASTEIISGRVAPGYTRLGSSNYNLSDYGDLDIWVLKRMGSDTDFIIMLDRRGDTGDISYVAPELLAIGFKKVTLTSSMFSSTTCSGKGKTWGARIVVEPTYSDPSNDILCAFSLPQKTAAPITITVVVSYIEARAAQGGSFSEQDKEVTFSLVVNP